MKSTNMTLAVGVEIRNSPILMIKKQIDFLKIR